MRTETRLAQAARPVLRASGLILFALMLCAWGLVQRAVAQDEDNRAGLVVQFGDGSVYTACVDLGDDGQSTGEEMLRDSGLPVIIDYSSGYGDGIVCKVADEGCDFPAEKCFCQCTMRPGDPCIYWIYFHQVADEWRYSNQGLKSHAVKAGDVEAWVWGAGSSQGGVLPSPIAFDEICSVSEESMEPTSEPEAAAPDSPSGPLDTPMADLPPTPLTRSVASTSVAAPTSLVSASGALSATPTMDAVVAPAPQVTARVAMRAEDGSTGASIVQPSPTSPIQVSDQDSQSKTSYFVFGLLVVVLAGGLAYLRTR
jgi:hypothetical protein